MSSEYNVYQRSTAHIRREPEDQAIERKEEEFRVRDEYPLLQEVIDRLSERIDHYTRVDSISSFDNAEKFMHQMAGNKIAAENLAQEREYLISLVSSYVKPTE